MDRATGSTVRLRIDIAYDGSRFSGWARQRDLRTVQGELEAALATIVRSADDGAPALTVAGRTDAGVHATGQVAHVDLTRDQVDALGRGGLDRVAARLNGIAGRERDLWVDSVRTAPPGFDARFSAVWRRYRFRIADADAIHDPALRGTTLWWPTVLDVEAMDSAARLLPGLHDWAAYCRGRAEATTVRTLLDYSWRRDPDGVAVAEVRADAFCHNMVRGLVGASIAVGEGRLGAEDLVELRDRASRAAGFAVVPPHGLTLVEIGYPPDAELASRSARTRARRAPVRGLTGTEPVA